MKIFGWIVFLSISSFLLATMALAQTPSPHEKVISSWIRQHAIPIKHVTAGNEFSDLQPFKQILKDVKVVGLGEATHGTREFFQFKHRLFEFLVKEMNFTGFALEASYTACEPINEYVLHGKGELATVLTGQGYSPWDTEELYALIDWMRNYNQSVAEDKKVRFYGIDFPFNEPGRKKVLTYVQKHAPEKVSPTDSLFSKLSLADTKWPMRIGEFKGEAEVVLPHLQGLIHYLTENKAKFVSASSPNEFEQIIRYTKLMEQFLMAIINYPLRTRFMAENTLYILDKTPGTKLIVSAHNRHINLKDHVGDTNLGHNLRDKLGNAYYAINFETNQVFYQGRAWMPDRLVVTDFKEFPLTAAPEKSLTWYLSRANKGNIFLDLRSPIDNLVVEKWWNTPQVVNDIAWLPGDNPAQHYLKVNLKSYYDGILFIEKTTRARPTKNAKKLASQNISF